MSSQPLLFLGFDGVLHPVDASIFFTREEHLAKVLSDFPGVEIVISSAWRKTHSLKNMREFFLTDLRARIVGVTPVFKVGEANTMVTPGSLRRRAGSSSRPARPIGILKSGIINATPLRN